MTGKKLRRCFDRILIIPLNLGIFGDVRDNASVLLANPEAFASFTVYPSTLGAFSFPAFHEPAKPVV